jgi:hypothetical protein
MTQEENKDQSEKRPGVSRREFIAGTVGGLVVGAVVGAAAGSVGFPKTVTQTMTQTATQTTTATTTAQPWLPAKWDYTADVVIVGDGFAALNAAISAHDAGSNVLMLEKMDQAHEGGSSKVTGGGLYVPLNATVGAATIKAGDVGQVSDPTIFSAMAQGLIDNVASIQTLGGTLSTLSTSAVSNEMVLTVNGKSALGGGLLYSFFRNLVASRNVNVLYSTPATSLIQNANTKEILGVAALTGGTVSSTGLPTGGNTINIKANKGVILATGAMDYNFDMQSVFQSGYPVLSWGGYGNTGDGIKMAQQVGADLWHLTHPPTVGAGLAMKVPDYPYSVGCQQAAGIGSNYIWVDKNGNRFVNETIGAPAFEYLTQWDPTSEVFLRIPAWVVFDDTARAKGPFVNPSLTFNWFLTYSGYTWSKDNSAEIAKGWILKADTISDLATSIATDADNQNAQGQPLMTATALQATVTRFNGFVTAGSDTDFGRPASTMAQIQTAPFYAIKTWPSSETSKGGPRRNANCQIVDPYSNPIPRLFGAGTCGSFNGGSSVTGGIGESIWTGRTAGTNAAAATPWS